jgi:multidrug resistance efflux pump
MRERQPVEIAAALLPGVILSGRLDGLAHATGAQFSVIPLETAKTRWLRIMRASRFVPRLQRSRSCGCCQ